jgi:hypothetical protein
VSLRVHAFPSLHAIPSAAAGFEHAPVLGLHVPATWHASLAAHGTGFDPVQAPFWHVSVCVHPLPSEHAVPLAATGLEHAPVVGLQVPATWHASAAAHVTAEPAPQTPLWQVSPCVQPFPSSHAVPLTAAGFAQIPYTSAVVVALVPV